MSDFNYALSLQSYTWKNALLWGNFKGHCEKACNPTIKWNHRLIHALILTAELLPILSQIASICEKILVTNHANKTKKLSARIETKPTTNKKNVITQPLAPLPPKIETTISVLQKENDKAKALQKKLNDINFVNLDKYIEKYKPENVMNHLVMHLMMDKLFIKEKGYEGTLDIVSVRTTRKALNRLKEDHAKWPLGLEIQQYLINLNAKLSPLLEAYEALVALKMKQICCACEKPSEDLEKKYLNTILNNLKKLNVGESILIPIGCKNHSTDLLIKKTSLSAFRLTHYNTGYGLPWHHRYKDTYLYQTHDIMDEVPAKSVLDEESWKPHLSQLKEQETMDFAYHWIRNHIGKGGILLPASPNEEDYEAHQFSGTCPTQSKMALIRHEIIQMVPGSPSEKEAAYKAIKTYLFLQYLKDNGKSFDDNVVKYLPSILEKLKAEEALIQISQSAATTQETLEVFSKVFEIMGVKYEELFQLPKDSSQLSRYGLLRKLSLHIFKRIHAEQIKLPIDMLKSPAMTLVSAKLNHYKIVQANITALLDQTSDADDHAFISQLYFIISSTPHTKIGIAESIKQLAKEIPTSKSVPNRSKMLLEKLHYSHHQNDHIVKALTVGLNSHGNKNLSSWMQNYWNKL